MSIRESFSQAMRDRLKKDHLVGPDLNSQPDADTEINRYLRDTDEVAPGSAEERQQEPSYTRQGGQNPTPSLFADGAGNPFAAAEQEIGSDELTVISRNTVIEGNVRSFASMNVEGSIKGNIQITKNIEMSGKVVGDISCNNVSMRGSSMQGKIASKGQLLMDRDALILGDISAQYADINGKIKGNVDISGKAEIKNDAVVFGDISVSTISVLDGATIQGYINTTFLKEENARVFPEAIIVNE